MKNSTIVCGAILFFICNHAIADNLCKANEINVFSFLTKARKNLSICRHTNDEYLVYRYGIANDIFQYPKNLVKDSWGEFSFSGMMRGGGKENAGFGDYDLTFSNGDYTYSVFQRWNDEGDTYDIGVTVRNEKTKRATDIRGLKKLRKVL